MPTYKIYADGSQIDTIHADNLFAALVVAKDKMTNTMFESDPLDVALDACDGDIDLAGGNDNVIIN